MKTTADDSSDECDNNNDEDTEKQMASLFQNYIQAGGNALQNRHTFEEFVHETYTCLICIEKVRKDDKLWHCASCRCSYHLDCARRWATESVAKFLLSTEEDSQNGSSSFNVSNSKLLSQASWCCPKCRFEYSYKECPKEYRCFCGKTPNPSPDLWTVPHSCGAVCRRQFTCGHVCLLLCHPGQCPPCPKVVEVSCFCGKSPQKALRCFQSKWCCDRPCGKKLPCGLHRCEKPCHDGECNECCEKFERPCACGKHKQLRPCQEKAWSCETICDKTLSCGRHSCPQKCHRGACAPCASSNRLFCPCGKTAYESGDCIDDLKCCGDTCDKILDCSIHRCVERCHRGSCGVCLQERLKRCRCGIKEKTTTCGKEFLCDVKCKQKRPCGKHACNRKCCLGAGSAECSQPCEKPCLKTLQCGNHQCAMLCHAGPCYPCILTRDVKCRCGGTVIQVPCGQERVVKPPKCKVLCKLPPVCKHSSREPHKCHFADCPPCRQICGLLLRCRHQCSALCHNGVMEDVNKGKITKPASPWEKTGPKFELVDKPCPPCDFPVTVSCFGEHVAELLPCHRAKPFDCGRRCGKMLSCGNHKCQQPCHNIVKTPCDMCEQKCSLKRPKGCPHHCLLPCHPAPCPECRLTVTMPCHCGLNQKLIPCQDWCSADETGRHNMLKCGNQCPKLLTCGHNCTLNCHLGPCSATKDCQKRIQLRCPCRRKIVKVMCNKKHETKLDCDDECEKCKPNGDEPNELKNGENFSNEETDIDFGNLARRKRKKKLRNSSDCDIDARFWQSKLFIGVLVVGVLSSFFGYMLFIQR